MFGSRTIPIPTQPDCNGVWVRTTDGLMFGRLASKDFLLNSRGDIILGYWVLWEPRNMGGGKTDKIRTASFCPMNRLELRPYKPKPIYARLLQETCDV